MQNNHEGTRAQTLNTSITSLVRTHVGSIEVKASNGNRMARQTLRHLQAWQEGRVEGVEDLEILEDAILHVLAEETQPLRVTTDG